MDQLATVRSIIRKDLESVGMIPTGVAVQMIAKDDPLAGVGLLIEAIYVWMFNGRSHEDIVAYLSGPLQVPENMTAYLISTAVHVREVFRRHQGNGKATMLELMKDKGAEKEQVKLLITTCHTVGKEYGIALDKRFPIEDEVEKVRPRSTPATPGISDQEAQARIAKLKQLLRKDLESQTPAAIPSDLLPSTLLDANEGEGTDDQVIDVLFRHILARCIQGWYGVRIHQELARRLALPEEVAAMLLARAGGMVALVRGLAYDLPRIERGFRQMPGDAKDQEERISNVRAVFETMRRAGVDKLPKFRMKPFWKFW